MRAKRKAGGGRPDDGRAEEGASPAFLLAQVGAHAAARFAERLGPHGLTPGHVGSLRVIAAAAGSSQQAVAARLGMFPSRLVALVDELQELGLVERRESPRDRRICLLAVTARGRQVLDSLRRVAREHQDALLAALNTEERRVLASLLLRIADQQELRRGVHPGFKKLRSGFGRSSRPPDGSKKAL
jgi:DNA-binding MarR family transcriptional regulator